MYLTSMVSTHRGWPLPVTTLFGLSARRGRQRSETTFLACSGQLIQALTIQHVDI